MFTTRISLHVVDCFQHPTQVSHTNDEGVIGKCALRLATFAHLCQIPTRDVTGFKVIIDISLGAQLFLTFIIQETRETIGLTATSTRVGREQLP